MTLKHRLSSSSRYYSHWAIVALGIAAVGCGSGLPPAPALSAVEGKITMDQKPLPGAVVMFMPQEGRTSVGLTDQAGIYRLEFDAANKGAVPGKHKVRITSGMEADRGAAAKGAPVMVPRRYNDNTQLTAEVKKGELNKIDFELTSKP